MDPGRHRRRHTVGARLRGLWGPDTHDKLGGERGPAGPRYEHKPRAPIVGRPVGSAGLGKVTPNPGRRCAGPTVVSSGRPGAGAPRRRAPTTASSWRGEGRRPGPRCAGGSSPRRRGEDLIEARLTPCGSATAWRWSGAAEGIAAVGRWPPRPSTHTDLRRRRRRRGSSAPRPWWHADHPAAGGRPSSLGGPCRGRSSLSASGSRACRSRPSSGCFLAFLVDCCSSSPSPISSSPSTTTGRSSRPASSPAWP